MDESLLLGMAKDHANFYQHDDPWDLPPYFLLRKNMWKSMRTHSGYWQEKEEELTAIRSTGESSTSASPSYVGVRKTLEFYLNDGTNGGKGTKTDWIIHEYHNLRKDDTGTALFLQEDVVVRKVFNKKCKDKADHASSLYHHVESCVKAYKKQNEVQYSRRREGLDLPSIAHRRPQYQGGNSPEEELESLLMYVANSRISGINQSIDVRAKIGKIIMKLVLQSMKVLNNTGESQNEDLGVQCTPDGKSDNVWKHFTKICSSSNPDEVYAACHRCDMVLKAHPKKHEEDRDILGHLCTYNQQQQTDGKLECEEVNVDLAQLDPRDLVLTCPTPWYITSSLNRQTHGGHWKEINKEFTAIRMDDQSQMQGCWKDIDKGITVTQMDPQLQMQVAQPQYMGLRRTLQFHHQDGRKMDWIMLEYQLINDINSTVLFLQGGIVIRKVFYYDKDAVTAILSDIERRLNGENKNEEYHNGDQGMNIDTTKSSDYMHRGGDRKRKRSAAPSRHKSEVWMHFTKIYNTDCGLVYVVCYSCDRGYSSGRSTNGTSHLRRHKESCASKRRRTGNVNDVTTEWETEIWPLFKNYIYGEIEHQVYAEARSQ